MRHEDYFVETMRGDPERWQITKENVKRWRSASLNPAFEPPPGIWRAIVFAVTDYLLNRGSLPSQKR